jgi:polyhydroxybutyrate depolymerase
MIVAIALMIGCGAEIPYLEPQPDGGSIAMPRDATVAQTPDAGVASPDAMTIPCGPTLAAGTHPLAVEHGGMMREYLLHVPESYDSTVPGAVILNLHGEPSSARQQEIFSNMNDAAELEGYLVVYPEGVGGSWNAGGTCCGEALERNIDDVGFIRALIGDLADRTCIDRTRIFATGLSAGGYMASRLACEASDVIAAIAPVAAARY